MDERSDFGGVEESGFAVGLGGVGSAQVLRVTPFPEWYGGDVTTGRPEASGGREEPGDGG